jgi:amino acid transporter
MGRAGFVMIVIAALVATSSAINATLLGSGRITFNIAKSGELPGELKRQIHGQPLEGMLIFAGLTLIIANFVPLSTIAAAGSSGFLVIFLAVNIANVRVAKQTNSRWYISALGALLTLIALVALCTQVISSGSSAELLFIFGMVGLAFGIEFVYRAVSGRTIRPSRFLLSDKAEEHS